MSKFFKIFLITIFLSVQLNAFIFPLLMLLSSKKMTPEEKKESYIYYSIKDIDGHLKKYFDILTWKNYPNKDLNLDRNYVDAKISTDLSLTFTINRDTFTIKDNPTLEKEILNNIIDTIDKIFINKNIDNNINKIIYTGGYDKNILERINEIVKITEKIEIDEDEFLKTNDIAEVDKYENLNYKKIHNHKNKYDFDNTNNNIEKEIKKDIGFSSIEVKDFSTKKDPF